jgi:hypothetical protein
MSWPSRIAILLVVLYGAFFSWYTSFGGALTPDEISHYSQVLLELEASPERLAKWKIFMESDTGNDFAMLNAIELRETPTPGPGIDPGDTTREVMAKYTTPFMGRAFASAAHPVFMGTAAAPALDVWGIEGANDWTIGGLVRYRSRRDLLEQAVAIRALEGTNIHDFKIAAIEKTIAFPVDPWFQLGDPRLVLALVFGVVGLSVQAISTRG